MFIINIKISLKYWDIELNYLAPCFRLHIGWVGEGPGIRVEKYLHYNTTRGLCINLLVLIIFHFPQLPFKLVFLSQFLKLSTKFSSFAFVNICYRKANTNHAAVLSESLLFLQIFYFVESFLSQYWGYMTYTSTNKNVKIHLSIWQNFFMFYYDNYHTKMNQYLLTEHMLRWVEHG